MRQHLEIRRDLADTHHFMIAEMQAQLARFVGTHQGSPFQLIPIGKLGVELLPFHALAQGARRASKRDRSLTLQRIQARLLEQAPDSAAAQLDDVKIAHASALGRGAMRTIALGLADPTLDAETVAMTAAADEVLHVSPPIHRRRFLYIGHVGHEYAEKTKRMFNETLTQQNEVTISLDPLRIGNAIVSLRRTLVD